MSGSASPRFAARGGARARIDRGAGTRRDRGNARAHRAAGESGMTLEPPEIGIIGSIALLFFCFIGVRIAYAAAIVGTIGLALMIGWDSGLRTAGVIPHAKTINYTLSVLPMFIIIGYLAYYAGITQAAFEA